MKKLLLILFVGVAQVGFSQDTIIRTDALSTGVTIVSDDNLDLTKDKMQDDYWNLSEQLFNFLIYDKSPTDVSTYKISSSYFQENLNMSSDYFLDTGPYEIIQYNIRIKPSQHNKYLANAKILNYNWDTFNCGEITERIMHPKEIDEHEKKIEFILLNGNKSNRKKTELYLVKFRGSEFEMNIKCTKSFSLYSKPLRNELFIVRVMKKINYYSKEYGCVEIVAVN